MMFYDKFVKNLQLGKFLIKARHIPVCLLKPVQRTFKREIFLLFCFQDKFWPVWIRIPNPDPLTQLKPDPKLDCAVQESILAEKEKWEQERIDEIKEIVATYKITGMSGQTMVIMTACVKNTEGKGGFFST